MANLEERKRFREYVNRMSNGDDLNDEEWCDYCEIGSDIQCDHEEKWRGIDGY